MKEIPVSKRQLCTCGYRVRGPNHEEGKHHKQKHPKKRREEKAA